MENIKEQRKLLRKEKIKARDSLSAEERNAKSAQICAQLLASEEFGHAKTILIYKGIRGEVRLDALEQTISKLPEPKTLAYPLVISNEDMVALVPEGEDAWTEGYFGISEPVRGKSAEIAPEDIDLIVCPCTAFDEEGGRMGMGAGFYDRYIEKAKQGCAIADRKGVSAGRKETTGSERTHAGRAGKPAIVAVAFECQKSESVIKQPWDQPMEAVFTEERVYRFKGELL